MLQPLSLGFKATNREKKEEKTAGNMIWTEFNTNSNISIKQTNIELFNINHL